MSPSKKSNLIVALGIGKPKRESAPPGMPRMPGGDEEQGIEPDAPEELAEGDGAVPPAAVGYHGEAERCDGCEYYKDGDCTWLRMPVDAGGHCSLFEASSEETGGEEEMPEMEMGA